MNERDNATPHLSGDYDAEVRRTIPCYDMIHDAVLDVVRATMPRPRLWLDTGCGTGTLVARAAAEFPFTMFMLADPSKEMLSAACCKLDGIPRERLIAAESCGSGELELPDGERPDVITAIQSHHYMDREGRERAVRRCADLLTDGGLFVTFENTRPFTERGIAAGKDRWARFQRGAGRTEEEAARHMERFDREYFPITVEEHLSLLRGCGFSAVELLWYSYLQAGFYCIK